MANQDGRRFLSFIDYTKWVEDFGQHFDSDPKEFRDWVDQHPVPYTHADRAIAIRQVLALERIANALAGSTSPTARPATKGQAINHSDTKLEDVNHNLSLRTRKKLRVLPLVTIGDLAELNEDELSAFPGIGDGTIAEIRMWLKRYFDMTLAAD